MTAVIAVEQPAGFLHLPWRIGPVRSTDGAALDELFARCSAETIALRFFGRISAWPPSYRRAVLAGEPEQHDAVVARNMVDGRLAGLASLGAGSEAGPDVPEIGVLVADEWQRQGLGAAMAQLLVARARARGMQRLLASVRPGRSSVLSALAGLDLERSNRTRDAVTAVYRLR